MNRNSTFSCSIGVQSIKERLLHNTRAQYIVIQTIKNREIEGYGQDEASF